MFKCYIVIVNGKDTNGIECLIVFDESDLSSIDEIEMPDVNETNKEAVEQLLSWTDIPAQAVYDAVRRVLVNAGIKEKVAVSIALAIKESLSCFFSIGGKYGCKRANVL